MRTACILGCGGFIGSHLAERLLEEGWRVRGVDLADAKIAHLRGHPGLEFHRLDVRDEARLAPLLAGCDAVLHLSSVCNPSLYNTQTLMTISSNFLQALPIVRACRERGLWLIHFSTCEVYGRTLAGYAPEGSPFREDPVNYLLSEDRAPLIMGPVSRTRWCYAAAKQLLERVIEAEGRENGLRHTVVRPFNFIGPRMDYVPGIDGEGLPRVVACFFKALRDEAPLPLVDGGAARRTFVAISDATEAVSRMLARPEAAQGLLFNIGAPSNEATMRALAGLMIEEWSALTGRPFPHGTRDVPSSQFYGDGYEDCDRRVPDITRARERLGWEPRADLRETVRRTLAGFRAQYGDGRER